jgi:hypothetical protein
MTTRLTALAIILAILIKLRIHEIVTGPLWWSFGS